MTSGFFFIQFADKDCRYIECKYNEINSKHGINISNYTVLENKLVENCYFWMNRIEIKDFQNNNDSWMIFAERAKWFLHFTAKVIWPILNLAVPIAAHA